jgi:uncharacterized membrane protein YeaQ/YmgE (transglycosylase-associated protein family)
MGFLDNLIWVLLVGAAAGWLAGFLLLGEGYGVIRNVLFGVVGGALANVLLGLLALLGIRVVATSLIGQLVTATLGALLLLYLLQRFKLFRRLP